MIMLVAICSIAFAAWAFINRPVSVCLGMSEDSVCELLSDLGAIRTPPVPANANNMTIDRTNKSIRYWHALSDSWALPDQNVIVATAFDDNDLVHLMIWEYEKEPERKDGLASATYKSILEFEVSADGSVYAFKSVD
jgi:hypothetical protein